MAPDAPPLPKSRTLRSKLWGGGYLVSQEHCLCVVQEVSRNYICLFICANIRAVHLEVVTDLSEENFMQTFRRFVNRKSFPQLMISDNASSYQLAAKELEKLFNSTILSKCRQLQESTRVWWVLGKTYWTYQNHTQESARKNIHLIH